MAMDFHKSAEELQILRRKLGQTQLPSRSGPKDSVPDGSEEQAERLEQQFEQFEEILTEERILRKGNISVGKWSREENVAEIEIRKGVHLMVFGKTVGGKLVLEPEEALYMVDHGMLELFYNGLPMSIQQAYESLLSDAFPLYHYVVYSYLRNLGFIVLRHERRQPKEELEGEIEEEMGENMEEMVKGKIEGKLKERDEHFEGNVEEMKEIMEGKMKEVEENMEEKLVNEMEQNVEEKEEMKEKLKGEMEEEVGEKITNKMEEETKVEKMDQACESVNVPETAVKPAINENNPVLHYWKEEHCQPLVHPSDSTSLDNILNKLQIIKSQTVMEASQHMHGSSSDFKIQFDVFQPQKQFRKTDPGLPNHCVCICKFSDRPPSIGEMNSLTCESSPVPLKYAVVDGKDVSFYSVLDVQLPVYQET